MTRIDPGFAEDEKKHPKLMKMAHREIELEECIARFIIVSKAFMKQKRDSLAQLRDCIIEGQGLLKNGGQ